MHILVTSHYGLPHQGGVEVVVEQVSRQWVHMGHQVTHLTSTVGQTNTHKIGHPAFTKVLIPAVNPLEKYAIPYPFFHPIKLYQSLKSLVPKVDIVNVQGLLYMSSILAASLAKQHHIPVTTNEFPGMVEYESGLVNYIEKLAFDSVGRFTAQRSDALIYHNQLVADSIAHYFKSHTRFEKISVGVDTSKYKPTDSENRQRLREKWRLLKPTALFVGRLVYRKGIRLLEDLVSDKFELLICGRGDAHIESANSRFLGFVSEADLIELYQASDIFILLTDGNDFPLVGLETMACGLPVVLFDIPANHEYHSTETALFVEETTKAISSGVEWLIADTERLNRMRIASRKRAVENFDWSTIAAKYLDLFWALLEPLHK
jgi:glycosyltransferase involved in cell wall biosynthesis